MNINEGRMEPRQKVTNILSLLPFLSKIAVTRAAAFIHIRRRVGTGGFRLVRRILMIDDDRGWPRRCDTARFSIALELIMLGDECHAAA